MNKQEAINELMSKSREIIFGDDENVYLSRKRTIELISKIDEPQKVEKEKLYTVEIPNPNSGCTYVFLTKRVSGVSIDMSDNDRWKADKRNQLTEAEIRKDFEWAWQWAEEVQE